MTIRELEIVGLLAALAALWDQVTALLRYPRRWFVVCRRVDDDGARVIASYLEATARRLPGDGSYYRGDRVHIRALGRQARVFSEWLSRGNQLYWLGWRPIWFAYVTLTEGQGCEQQVFFLRWSIDWDAFLVGVAEWEDERMSSSASAGTRYRVRYHGCPAGLDGLAKAAEPPPASGVASGEFLFPGKGMRLVRWAIEDIGYPKPMDFGVMSLRPEQQDLVRDVDRFMRAREWFEERGIPWRRGWLAHGRPGTGKTSIIRGLAVEHDLPVHVFDLGAMSNTMLRYAWEEMQRDAPCIALLEDIDGVYGVDRDDGTVDTRAARGEAPTFDALLQAIGGISTCDGVLLFVTSNHPDRIDPALRRGGRIDLEVEFLGMDHSGRVKMATRVLGDAAAAEVAAADPELSSLSPADFQERLCRRALAEKFGAL